MPTFFIIAGLLFAGTLIGTPRSKNIAFILMILWTLFSGLALIWTLLLLGLGVLGMFGGWLLGKAAYARFRPLIRAYVQGRREYFALMDQAHDYHFERLFARVDGHPGPAFDPVLAQIYARTSIEPRYIWKMILDNGRVPSEWVPAAQELMMRNVAPPTLS